MKLTLVKSNVLDDWYLIERAEHDGRSWLEEVGPGRLSMRYSGRISDADVEGYSYEMREIAAAIERRGCEAFKRCAVNVLDADHVEFWSPRNSQKYGVCSLEEADELAKQIRKELGDGGQKT